MRQPTSSLHTWLQLLRAPNLFTVPGDPLAGQLIAWMGASDWRAWAAAAASLCFYGAGLLQNDLADLAEDRAERPSRPLPSGAATPGRVRAALWTLNLAGLALIAATARPAALIIACGIVFTVWLYNRVTKKLPILGALNMGACRSLSFLLGAATVPFASWTLTGPLALIFGLYIAAVTALARHETRPNLPWLPRFLPILPVAALCIFGVGFGSQSPDRTPAFLALAAAAIGALTLFYRLLRAPRPLPPLIGAHIRLLLPMQAAVCWLADPADLGRNVAIALLCAWPLSKIVSKKFYAS